MTNLTVTDDESFPYSEHSKVKKGHTRASYKKQPIHYLVDDLKLGHIGFIWNNRPVVIPMSIWRVEDDLFFHVVNKSRLQKLLEKGEEISISFAESNEWVMAKSAYHHSANYRSAVMYCTGSRVTDEIEFDHAFKVLIEQIEKGRWDKVRVPSDQERKATALMKLKINEASFKSRTGGATIEPEDEQFEVWTGTLEVCPYHSE